MISLGADGSEEGGGGDQSKALALAFGSGDLGWEIKMNGYFLALTGLDWTGVTDAFPTYLPS